MIETRIVAGPLPPLEDARGGPADGAEIIFHGRVRGSEGGEAIAALDYEHYPEMAEAELRRLAEETAERFGLSDLVCVHRVGPVAVGEASVRIVVRSPHRGEALEALGWFITELKRRVPIWKWAVAPDGSRVPTGGPDGPPEGATPPGPR